MIETYPKAIRRADGLGRLPIHIECENRCRPGIISKLIELYPESLSKACSLGSRPLHHFLLKFSSQDPVIVHLMIEAYPEAICQPDGLGRLPIHIECEYRCRPDIISKLIELYPESLSKACLGQLPLHNALSSFLDATQSSTIIDLMIETYPKAIRHANGVGRLPIHIECESQCRPHIISRLIELYPESLSLSDNLGHIPWSKVFSGVGINTINELRRSLVELISSASFSHPLVDTSSILIMEDPRSRLNRLRSCLSTAAHAQSYRSLNWQSRSSLLYLWLQISIRWADLRLKHALMLQQICIPQRQHTSLELLLWIAKSSDKIGNRKVIMLMMQMINKSSLLLLDASPGYNLHQGEGFGDLMLRFVTSYL
jgi:hypothetical protein